MVFENSYPANWERNILHPIATKGHSSATPKLRGIAISCLLAKIYDSMLMVSVLISLASDLYQWGGKSKSTPCLKCLKIVEGGWNLPQLWSNSRRLEWRQKKIHDVITLPTSASDVTWRRYMEIYRKITYDVIKWRRHIKFPPNFSKMFLVWIYNWCPNMKSFAQVTTGYKDPRFPHICMYPFVTTVLKVVKVPPSGWKFHVLQKTFFQYTQIERVASTTRYEEQAPPPFQTPILKSDWIKVTRLVWVEKSDWIKVTWLNGGYML